MNKIHQFPDVDKTHDQASLWIARLDKGLTAEERSELTQWLGENDENSRVLFRMAETWDKMDSLSRLQDIFPHVSPPESLNNRFGLAFASAAFAAVVLVLAVYLNLIGGDNKFPSESAANKVVQEIKNYEEVYETSVGEYSSVNLPDGTEVVLNTNSHIQVNYTTNERYIILDRGEAHFKVAKDSVRPLAVQAGAKIFQAAGTAFNIEIRRDNEVELIVTEGRVVIHDKPLHINPAMPFIPIKGSHELPVISGGESAILSSTDTRVRKINPEEVAIDLSWQEGNLVFDGETLEEAILEISRYTSVEFEILDDKIKTIRVVGLFKAGDINGLIISLRDNFQISARRVGTERILLTAR